MSYNDQLFKSYLRVDDHDEFDVLDVLMASIHNGLEFFDGFKFFDGFEFFDGLTGLRDLNSMVSRVYATSV